MASSPFNAQIELYRIATFSQFFFSLKCSYSCNNIFLPRRVPRSRNVHLVLGNSSCQFSVLRNLSYSQRPTGISLIAFDAKNSSESKGEADNNHALERLFKFFSAVTRKFTPRKSETLADQWLFLSNFLSLLEAFPRKKQVWEVFSYLIEVFGNNIQIVVKQTLYDGLNIGVQWKFESKKIQVPLGKGFSFYISHSYKGKAMIRNSETFIKPLLRLLPFRLKIMASAAGLRERIGSLMEWAAENRSNKIWCLLIALFAIAAAFFFFRILPFKIILKLMS